MQEITAAELEEMLISGKAIHIIDVRSDEEVAEGMIPGAIHIPLDQMGNRLQELPKEDHLYFICRSGIRSGQACEVLEQLGYRVANVTDGMLAWKGEVVIY